MLQTQFINIIKQPLSLEKTHLSELELLINEYPFFETAHLLYVKGLSTTNAINYSKQLRKTAIVANSRTILYELLHKKEFLKNKESLTNLTPQLAEKTEPENILPTNNITVTNNEVKVIYVNTVSTINPVQPELDTAEKTRKEIDIVKDIENETNHVTHPFDEEKLNHEIEAEINKGIIQSYVATDIIKTQELNKQEVSEPVSFTDWLNKIKKESGTIQTETKSITPTENTASDTKKQILPQTEKKAPFFSQNKEILDKIIESDPGRIKLTSNKFFTPNIDAKQSLLENEHLVTETLAKIYALQGNISKAIRAYEILSLKFPQKSVYFASLIEKLKTNK